ncbi:dihydrolipoamide dehydrogenase [Mesobaculum littorinae]|uniref:Dihydrolipoamide dehydrogenase n=1 Tax=Mesobaculum littorinae TaxID=2486419 RepID=A0A438AEI1_9RHOB|nr:FAD-dependent oxidoreductase [Mesobaculum littorinae]RVV97094.1 dihydrolipoamide dehydrogenase [Mesobaculum littorinae]
MDLIETDVCVIGAGSGGLSVAAGTAQMGAKTVLIEGGEMGGDCLNYGCVPSKALIAAAEHAHALRSGGPYGVAPVEPQIDYAAAMDHVQAAIRTIAPVDSQERFEGLGVRVIRDWARFTSPEEVEAGGARIRARRFVIATGSSPMVPPIDGLGDVPYLTNETLFENRERPRHLIVIGGGPIGCEMAQAHRRLGCEVTVIEGGAALGKEDAEAAQVVLARMRAEGVKVFSDAQAEKVEGRAGDIAVTAGGQTHQGSHLLVAVGRRINLDRLNLDAANVAHDRGITVDDRLRSTTNSRVYAVGDAAGGMQFTHLAGYHGGQVVRSIMFGLRATAETRHIPRVTYTAPELAQIGPTEAEARQVHGDKLEVVRAAFDENDRAIAAGETEGFVKVMVVDGYPIGVTMVGAQAGELIGLWSLAISQKLKLQAISGTVLPYPTLNEVSKKAAGAYFSKRLFDNPWVKRAGGLVQRVLP